MKTYIYCFFFGVSHIIFFLSAYLDYPLYGINGEIRDGVENIWKIQQKDFEKWYRKWTQKKKILGFLK